MEKLWQTYMIAKTPDDLRTAFDQIYAAVEEATSKCERRYSVLFGNLQHSIGALSNRLRIEEDARLVAAENLLQEGVTGVALIRRILPLKVETPLRSYALGLEGRVDAISERDGDPFPIEYKTGLGGDPLRTKAHEIQVAAYCMLLEEDTDSPCDYGEIYYTRYLARRPVVVTRSKRKAVLDLRDRFLKICTETPTDLLPPTEVSHA